MIQMVTLGTSWEKCCTHEDSMRLLRSLLRFALRQIYQSQGRFTIALCLLANTFIHAKYNITCKRDDTAALVVGGIRNLDLGEDGIPGGDDDLADIVATAEIFGCPQSPDSSVQQFF